MAEHKVPQDVEAEDKLLGPFSFRQFIYLMIAAGAGALAFFLGRMAFPLAIIPLPVFLLFGTLALPLRKDQPMETYVAAMIRYFFSPHIRLWDADGQEGLVEISNPVVDEGPHVKDVGGEEAARRLSFLADIEDSQGWVTRGIAIPTNKTILKDDLAISTSNAPDILDNKNSLSESFDDLLNQSDEQVRRQAVTRMQNDMATSPPATSPVAATPPLPSSSPPQPVPATTTVPSATIPPDDEAMARNLLNRAAANTPPADLAAMNQTVIQPPTATPTAAASPSVTSTQPPTTQPTAQPVVTTTSPQPEPTSLTATDNSVISTSHPESPTPERPTDDKDIAQTKPAESETAAKSTIEPTHDIIKPSQNQFDGEELINHDQGANNDQTVEISLH
jgi:hypothetical protein